jgi:hypothetical protein
MLCSIQHARIPPGEEYGAATCTGIDGILHLILAPNAINFNINNNIFFLVAQLFWMLPTLSACHT